METSVSTRLASPTLVAELAEDGRLSVVDKRTGIAWRQVELPLPWLKIDPPPGAARAV